MLWLTAWQVDHSWKEKRIDKPEVQSRVRQQSRKRQLTKSLRRQLFEAASCTNATFLKGYFFKYSSREVGKKGSNVIKNDENTLKQN
jgi:hypothetical protein